MTEDIWVVNASPIILLSRAGLVELLHDLPGQLFIPRSVFHEVSNAPEEDVARVWAERQSPRILIETRDIPPEIALASLGEGESGVLAACLQYPGSTAILDDRAARNCAKAYGIKVRGTLGILVLAKEAGLIEAVAPVIDLFQNSGMRLGEEVRRSILDLAGESHD